MKKLTLKVRATETTTGIILNASKKVLADVQQRCTQALKVLEQKDHLVALGANIGLEEQIRPINVRLLVLRKIYEIQKQKMNERRNR